jgi:SAM-dependent methyltransferase
VAEAPSFFTDGQAYHRLMGRWSRAVGEVFLGWLALPKGLNWLDVGCGTGTFTELVIDRCAPSSMSAIDPSEDQINYARSGHSASQVTFRTGDAQSLPFADHAFNVAAMAFVINFVPDGAKATAEMKRVVKPQGTVAAYVWDYLGGGSVQRPLVEALIAMGVDAPAGGGGLRNTRIEELRTLFEQTGLDQVATRTIEIERIRISMTTGVRKPDWRIIPSFSPSARCRRPTSHGCRPICGTIFRRIKADASRIRRGPMP